MDQNELARIFNDSYERVMNAPGKSGEFFVAFYKLFIAANPEAAIKFGNTDMVKQARILHASVAILLTFYGIGREDDYLRKLAQRHSRRELDIDPELYSIWLDCLIKTVHSFDPRFNDDVETVWRAVFSKGIEFMASRYEGS